MAGTAGMALKRCIRSVIKSRLAQTTRQVNSLDNKIYHVPVMKNEVLEILRPQDRQIFLDMTFGGGGHTRSILDSCPDVKVYALDRDPQAFNHSVQMASVYENRLFPMLGKFSDLPQLLSEKGINENYFDGILFDFGCSSMQFDQSSRGFALSSDGRLDMRMDGDRIPNQPTAADVVDTLDEDDLYKIIKTYGEEKRARTIARAIVEARYNLDIKVETTRQLADLVETVLESEPRLDKLCRPAHPATKTFQALRIFVNDELNEIHRGIELAYHYLKSGAHLVALSFHSLEDRIVKRHLMQIDFSEPLNMTLNQKYRNCAKWHSVKEMNNILTEKKWNPLLKGIMYPTDDEVNLNPRSRSAKLRAATKVA